MKNQEIIKTIEEYRKAFWEHRNHLAVKDKKYQPIIAFNQVPGDNNKEYSVSLVDTWAHFKTGSFFIVKEPVLNSEFSGTNLQLILEELLNFVRLQFLDDNLFKKI